MHSALALFLDWLASTNHAAATVRNHRTGVRQFLRWCETATIADLSCLTPEVIEAYRLSLFRRRGRGNLPLEWSTQGEYLGVLKGFLSWCYRRGILARDVGAELVLPRRPYRLPLGILSAMEVERVLRQARPGTPTGLRDRAILELFYSTALRRAEVAHLRIGDVDFSRGVVLVRAGKGQRDRVTPIGRRALRWISRYLQSARPLMIRTVDPGVLFLTSRGRGFALNRLSERVSLYFGRAGFPDRGSCHLFRHTAATLLLEGEADIRDVQEILGHRNLNTTARYTHLSIARLQAVHARAHPAEAGRRRLAPRERGDRL